MKTDMTDHGPVAVVGLGAMGSRIARTLLDAGYRLTVWNRSQGRAEPLAALGASVAATPAEAASVARTLITSVADQAALRAVSEGDDGIAAGSHPALTIVEMSTVGPVAIARLAAALPAGTGLLDAPVLGSVSEAEAGQLTIFVGGPPAALKRVRPVLCALGSVTRVGPLGAGAAAKLVANSTLFGLIGTFGEAVALGRGLGLTTGTIGEILSATPLAGQAERRLKAIQADDYPPRFALELARKDADLIGQAAAAAGVELRLAAAARAWLASAEVAGWAGNDYTAMLAAILRRPGREPAEATRARLAGRQHSYDGLIIDLDGVVWLGRRPIAGAADAIARLRAEGIKVVFATNDPAWSRDAQAARLTEIGIPATAADVITTGYAAARYLASRRDLLGCGALVIGPLALRDEIAGASMRLVRPARARDAGLVVAAAHERFSYAELTAATRAIAAGARLFATGRDAVVPTSAGPVPATGAIVAAIEAATGVTATVLGKPAPYLFDLARQAMPDREHVAVVGDNLAADISGAKTAGMAAILVLTGSTAAADVSDHAPAPDLVLPSLAAVPDAISGRRATGRRPRSVPTWPAQGG